MRMTPVVCCSLLVAILVGCATVPPDADTVSITAEMARLVGDAAYQVAGRAYERGRLDDAQWALATAAHGVLNDALRAYEVATVAKDAEGRRQAVVAATNAAFALMNLIEGL